ncbi:MAG: hypothetical protein P8Z50_00425 [candidate division WOR-3 bacterium]|jgi:hypothetical protein
MPIEKLLDNFDIPTIVVFSIIGISLLVYIISKISAMVIKKKLNPLAEMLNGEIKSSFLGGTYISILNYGPEIRLKLTLGGKDNPSFLILELLNPIGFNLKIMKKQPLNQIFFRWGKEVPLENASLEENYIIRSDKPDEANSYLMDSNRVDAIKYFADNDFNSIEVNTKGVYVKKANYKEEDLDPGKVQTYLDNLNSFSRI